MPREDTDAQGGDLFFEMSMHQRREQYAAFMYMQTRAQQMFDVSAVIMGVLTTFLISPQVGLATVPRWLLAIIFVAFICLSVMCMLVLSSKGWHSGPKLDLLAEALPGVQQSNHSVPLWLGTQMNRSYKNNIGLQKTQWSVPEYCDRQPSCHGSSHDGGCIHSDAYRYLELLLRPTSPESSDRVSTS